MGTGPVADHRTGRVASATAGGLIFAVGGHTTDFAKQLDSVEVLHPGASVGWQPAASMLSPRGNPGAAAVGNNVYVFGGFTTPDEGTYTGERFDPSTDRWERVADPPEVTTGPGVAALGDRIYVVGGAASDTSLVRIYDPHADSFAEGAPMPTARELLKATVLDGKLHALGG